MGKVLAILGSGGHGREILELAKIVNSHYKKWDKVVFAEKESKNYNMVNDIEVVDESKLANLYGSNFEVIVGVGEPTIREKLIETIEKSRFNSATLIHPGVLVPNTSVIKAGSVIQQGCFISCNVEVGNHSYLQPNVVIGHNCKIGDNCIVSAGVNMGGTINIGTNTFIGIGVSIKQGLHIGKNSIIGMGSVVLSDIEDNTIAVGSPAHALRKRDDARIFS